MQPQEHVDSDSDDDPDYVPPAEERSDSESDGEPESKRARLSPPEETEEEKDAKKKAREALWAVFQASVSAPPPPKVQSPPAKLVKIEKRYRFAGEDVVEVKEVPEDSEDAKKWPLWRPPEDKIVESDKKSATLEGKSQETQPRPSSQPSAIPALESVSPSNSASTSVPAPPSASTPAPPPPTEEAPKSAPKRPGPRKPKIQLGSLPSSSSQKAKKLTTLDKSVMDWQAHINSGTNPDLKDELESNRRGGGYLEKVEFLQRVEERREGTLEAGRGKRRRG